MDLLEELVDELDWYGGRPVGSKVLVHNATSVDVAIPQRLLLGIGRHFFPVVYPVSVGEVAWIQGFLDELDLGVGGVGGPSIDGVALSI